MAILVESPAPIHLFLPFAFPTFFFSLFIMLTPICRSLTFYQPNLCYYLKNLLQFEYRSRRARCLAIVIQYHIKCHPCQNLSTCDFDFTKKFSIPRKFPSMNISNTHQKPTNLEIEKNPNMKNEKETVKSQLKISILVFVAYFGRLAYAIVHLKSLFAYVGKIRVSLPQINKCYYSYE